MPRFSHWPRSVPFNFQVGFRAAVKPSWTRVLDQMGWGGLINDDFRRGFDAGLTSLNWGGTTAPDRKRWLS